MKKNNNVKNTGNNKGLKKLMKKVDPISFALVLLLGAATTFAGFQLMTNTGETPVVNPNVGMGETDMPTIANDPEVTRLLEEVVIAPLETETLQVTMNFFNSESDATDLINSFFYFQVGNSKVSHQSNGMSFRCSSEDATNVVAALSGTVLAVEDDILRGTIVTIEHQNGVKTIYSGVYDVTLEAGATIAQGELIGTTGLSQLEPESGNVVHFEVIQNGTNLNPDNVIDQQLGEL